MKRRFDKFAVMLCLVSLMFTTVFAEEAKFIKVDGGYGLKDDGSLWKLPIGTDGMLKSLRKYLGENSDENTLDYENKKLRKLEFSDKKISDFDAYTMYNTRGRRSSLFSDAFTVTWEDGGTIGFNGRHVAEFESGRDHIASFNANAYISKEGDAYIYGDPNGDTIYSYPMKVEGAADVVSVAPLEMYLTGLPYLIDSDGELWDFHYEKQETIPVRKVTYIDLDNLKYVHKEPIRYGETAFLSKDGRVYIYEDFSRNDLTEINLTDVKMIDGSMVSNYYEYTVSKWYSDDGFFGSLHVVMLREDGTVWHTGSVQTYPSEGENYQSSGMYTLVPVQIKGIDNVADISVISDDIIMLRNDGSIIKWGTTSYKDFHTENPQKISTRNYNIMYTINKLREETEFYFNGENKEIDPGRGTSAKIYNDRTYIPIRSLIEGVGGSVEWDGQTQTITMNLWDKFVKMQVGSNIYSVNGEMQEMDVEPMIDNDRTLVPIRFVAEAFGFTINYTYNDFTHFIELFYHEVLL